MITFVVPEGRSWGFEYFIEDRGGPHAHRFRILFSEHLAHAHRLAPGTYVFALDDLLPAECLALGSVWDQMARDVPAEYLLNHPARTLGRFALLRTLYESGRSRVRAVRATEPVESLHFPVFVREETQHTGNLTPLLRSPLEVRRALTALALRGFRRHELLLVEFCNTADSHGVFRKYSAYVVGDHIIPRCLEFGEHWMVKHNPLSYDADRIAQERDYVESNPHDAQLREIFALAQIRYGRADYAVLDGALQVWEINLLPTIGRFRPRQEESVETQRVREQRRVTTDTFYARFLAAWEALDTAPTEGGEIAISVDERLWDAARAERTRWRRGERHKTLVAWAAEQRALVAMWGVLKPTLRRVRILFAHRDHAGQR